MTAEVLDKFSALITTALGLVAALAWNTAIQNPFNILFGQVGGKLVGQFFYAIHVTFVVIFATIYVGRAAERAKKNVAASSVAREGKRFAKREPRHQVSGEAFESRPIRGRLRHVVGCHLDSKASQRGGSPDTLWLKPAATTLRAAAT